MKWQHCGTGGGGDRASVGDRVVCPQPLAAFAQGHFFNNNTLGTGYVMCTDPGLKSEVQGRYDFFSVFISPITTPLPNGPRPLATTPAPLRSRSVLLPVWFCKQPNHAGLLESGFPTKQQGLLWARACAHTRRTQTKTLPHRRSPQAPWPSCPAGISSSSAGAAVRAGDGTSGTSQSIRVAVISSLGQTCRPTPRVRPRHAGSHGQCSHLFGVYSVLSETTGSAPTMLPNGTKNTRVLGRKGVLSPISWADQRTKLLNRIDSCG